MKDGDRITAARKKPKLKDTVIRCTENLQRYKEVDRKN